MATTKAVKPKLHVSSGDDGLLAIDPASARRALALEPGAVVSLRVNLGFARRNAFTAATAVLGQRVLIEAKVKKPDFAAVERLDTLVDSTEAASRALFHIEKSTSSLDQDLARLWPLRMQLLSMAEVLAGAGYLPMAAVDAIRAGRGKLDGAKDLVDLADLFAKHARKLVGKMGPITQDDLVEAKQLGKRLVDTIKPVRGRAPRPADKLRDDALNLRDRLNTLLLIDYETTWFLGAAAFGSKVDNFVPPLGSGGTKPPAPAKAKPPKKGADAEPEAEESGE